MISNTALGQVVIVIRLALQQFVLGPFCNRLANALRQGKMTIGHNASLSLLVVRLLIFLVEAEVLTRLLVHHTTTHERHLVHIQIQILVLVLEVFRIFRSQYVLNTLANDKNACRIHRAISHPICIDTHVFRGETYFAKGPAKRLHKCLKR